MFDEKGSSWGGKSILSSLAKLFKRRNARRISHSRRVHHSYHVAQFRYTWGDVPMQHVTVIRRPLLRVHHTYQIVLN